MGQFMENYNKIQATQFIAKFLPLLKAKIQDYEMKKNNQNYRMSSEDIKKADDRKDQFKKMDDINAILNMSQPELLKHEYLKFRIKRLEEVYPWLAEQSRRMQQNNLQQQ